MTRRTAGPEGQEFASSWTVSGSERALEPRTPAGPQATWSRPSTLSTLAREAILVRIVAGEIAPGQVYSAPVLAGVLGVSVTPVREALLELAGAGLVESVPNKGYRVVELSRTTSTRSSRSG